MDERIRQAAAPAQGDSPYPGDRRRRVRKRRIRGSALILDTNALSAFADGDAAVGELLRQQARACIPVIVLGEFRYGIARSRHRATYEGWLASQLAHFDVLPVTEETTLRYVAIRVALRQRGRPIPANDAWIAALALQHRLPVLSRDAHFDAVSRISRQSW
ncbi:MAG TPA: type II toxin-antitoxin system VapC family toxin [Casimicrobiaceae bacterium]|nr:type II toxin-antitoxin system VapC family toxin [Casimicrobiaceae bacterium]